MSVRAHFSGGIPPVGSAGRRAVLGAIGAPVRHMLDLACFLPVNGAGWTDALVSETRRHLAGCLDAVEAAFCDRLAGQERAVAQVSIWECVQHSPQIISSGLIAHMRARAAVALLARQDGVGQDGNAAPPGEDLSWLIGDADAEVARGATELFHTERRWSDPAVDIRPDLPAEHLAELAWIVAAFLADGLAGQSVARLADTAFSLIAAHDEGAGPIVRAGMLVRRLRDRPDAGVLLGQALGQRRFLLFAALAGEHMDFDTETALHALVHGSYAGLAGFCHALGGSASDYRHLLLQLKIVHADWSDTAILAAAEAFDRITPAQAEAALGAFRCPAELRAKLELIDPISWP